MNQIISDVAIAYVRERATSVMRYQCKIERIQPPTFNQAAGTATPGSRSTVYEGICRVWEISGGSVVMVGEDDVTMQSLQLSIPWGTTPVPQKHDEVTITAAPTDEQLVGRRFVIDSSAKAGELRATRRFALRGYEKK